MSKEGQIVSKGGKVGQNFSPDRFTKKKSVPNRLVGKLSSEYVYEGFTWDVVYDYLIAIGRSVSDAEIALEFKVDHESANAMTHLMHKAGVIDQEFDNDRKIYVYKANKKEEDATEGFVFISRKNNRGSKARGVSICRLNQKGKPTDVIRVVLSNEFTKAFGLNPGDKYMAGFKFQGDTPFMALKPSQEEGYTLSSGGETQSSQLVFKEDGNASRFVDMSAPVESARMADGMVLVELTKAKQKS